MTISGHTILNPFILFQPALVYSTLYKHEASGTRIFFVLPGRSRILFLPNFLPFSPLLHISIFISLYKRGWKGREIRRGENHTPFCRRKQESLFFFFSLSFAKAMLSQGKERFLGTAPGLGRGERGGWNLNWPRLA